MKIFLAALLTLSSISHAETSAPQSNVPVKPERKRKRNKEKVKDPKPLPPHLTKGPVHERPMAY